MRLDGKPTAEPVFSVQVAARSTIAIDGVGEIAVEPQITDRATMIERVRRAEDELKAALEAAGAADLPAARHGAAERQELVRELADKQREIGRLAPADKARKLPAGLEARENRVDELRGRLATELQVLGLASLPASADTEEAIAALRREDESISEELVESEAAVEGPKQWLAEAPEAVQLRQPAGRVAGHSRRQTRATGGRPCALLG